MASVSYTVFVYWSVTRRIRVVATSTRYRPSVRMWIEWPPTERIYVEFDIEDFPWISIERVKICLKLGENSEHFAWWYKYVLLLLAKLYRHKCPLWEWIFI
jgi:hypothetical protein